MKRALAAIAVSVALFVIDKCEPERSETPLRCDATQGEIVTDLDGTQRVVTTRNC